MFEVNHQSPTSLGAQPTADATTRLSIQARSWRQYLVSAALLAALFGAPAAVPTAAQVRPKSATHQQARPVGGKRIIKSVGMDMVKLEKYQGVAANFSTVFTLLFASLTGMPVSTGHCNTSAIMGVGASRSIKRVNWNIAKNMLLAWVITFPACGLIGFVLAKLFMMLA